VQGSLVQDLGAGRYQLHQLVREYLSDHLQTTLADQTQTLQRGVVMAMTEIAKTVNPTVTLKDLARLQDAIPHLTLVVEELTDRLPDDDVVWPFTALAWLAEGQSRWPEAERWYQQCRTLTETRLGADHPDVATSLNNLAVLYMSMGRYGEAEPLLKRSLAISEQQLGADHPHVAQSLNNLALLYEAMGRYGEAEPLLKRSLAISEQQLGADHPDVAFSLNGLAVLYMSMGRYGEAEPLYLRALDIQSRSLPENHPWNKAGWNNFVGMVQAALEAGQADQLSDHPTTQAVLQQLKSQQDH
jgi:tetratricopeptide (TPR) repeat protein